MNPTNLTVEYQGPPGMSNDTLGGNLEPGETYEAPSPRARDELLAHPAGWFKAAKTKE